MNTTIETSNGPIEINAELLNGYIDESGKHYSAISTAKSELKLIAEAGEYATGLKASTITKYIKAKLEEKTKEAKELGDLYDQLDAAIGE